MAWTERVYLVLEATRLPWKLKRAWAKCPHCTGTTRRSTAAWLCQAHQQELLEHLGVSPSIIAAARGVGDRPISASSPGTASAGSP